MTPIFFFTELIRRENKPPKKTAKSSFLVDSSSSEESFSNYRKILTKDIEEDANNINRYVEFVALVRIIIFGHDVPSFLGRLSEF